MEPKPPDELAAKRASKKTPAKRGVKKGRKVGTTAGPISGAAEIQFTDDMAAALQVRLAGANLAQVAEALTKQGHHCPGPVQAHRLIMRALKVILPDETRDEARAAELATINRLQMAHWQPALSGDDKSANIVLRCVKQRREMLGLDAPVQVAVSLYHGEPVEIQTLQVLDEETLAAARGIRSGMSELARLRAGAIDGTATEIE